MADKHFFSGVPGDSFPSGLGAASLYGSSPYAPPGLDAAAAAMQGFGMAWADLQLLPDSSSAGAGAAHFDSALTSLVSSLAHNGGDCYGAGAGGDDVAAIGDLIGRLSSICNGTSAAASASNSCYSTPLSSPPRGGYPFPGAAAAALEASGATGRLSRVASSKSLGAGATTPGMGSPDPAAETSTKVSGGGSEMRDPTPPTKGGAARKRKASGKGKAASSAMTAAAAANASPKRPKVAPDGGAGEGKDDDDGDAAAAPEPAKDYIHVRARRGQATDSHSLAERVRRGRISEGMKMLQSLVPGCNKITGKALMLDEIINYVQSLQRQVEFLSMKLETMSPAELDADARYHTAAMLASPHHPPPAAAFSSYAAATHPSPFVAAAFTPPLLDSCAAGPIRPGSSGWEAQDLQSLVAAVHGHDLYSPAPPLDGFHGEEEQHQMQTQQQGAAAGSHMKLERL